jgi:hypothetical protein
MFISFAVCLGVLHSRLHSSDMLPQAKKKTLSVVNYKPLRVTRPLDEFQAQNICICEPHELMLRTWRTHSARGAELRSALHWIFLSSISVELRIIVERQVPYLTSTRAEEVVNEYPHLIHEVVVPMP